MNKKTGRDAASACSLGAGDNGDKEAVTVLLLLTMVVMMLMPHDCNYSLGTCECRRMDP